MKRWAVLALLVQACSRSAPDVAVPTHEFAAPKPPAPTAKVLFSLSANLDGTGIEPISLDVDGVLRVGALSRKLELAYNEFFFADQASLRVVALDGALRGLLFTEPTSEGEDPPNRYRLYLKANGGLEVAFDRVIGVYGVTPLTFPGKREARYVEDGWTACERAKFPKHAGVDEVTFRMDAAFKLVEASRTATGKTVNCNELAG